MGSLGTALVFLVQFCALRGATGLSVRQEPQSLRAGRGSQVRLSCQVSPAQAWEQLRVRWTKDWEHLCHLLITNGSLRPGRCGARGWLSWQASGHLTLLLEHVGVNDSGEYVCWAAVEIPELEEAKGNGTQLVVETDGRGLTWAPFFPGLLFPLLVAGAVAVAAVVLGARIWGRRHCRPRDSGNALYGNVLHRPRGPPKKSEACSGKGKVLGTPRPGKKVQSFYSTSFPQPPIPQPHLPPKPCPSPRPHHPASMARVSPTPGPSGQPRPRGTPEVGKGVPPPDFQKAQ